MGGWKGELRGRQTRTEVTAIALHVLEAGGEEVKWNAAAASSRSQLDWWLSFCHRFRQAEEPCHVCKDCIFVFAFFGNRPHRQSMPATPTNLIRLWLSSNSFHSFAHLPDQRWSPLQCARRGK